MQIIILGSCITRDAFDLGGYQNDQLSHILYFARTSLISLNAESFRIDVNTIEGVNLFQKRLIASEMNKDFYKTIESRNLSDSFLIIDFVDERLDLLDCGSKKLTISQEFDNSSLKQAVKGNRIARGTISNAEWDRNCRIFTERILSVMPPERIVLHQAFWSEVYADQGIAKVFDAIKQIRYYNDCLRRWYDVFTGFLPDCNVIDLNGKRYLADRNHRWGFSPIHYEPGYYQQFIREFDRIVQNVAKHSSSIA